MKCPKCGYELPRAEERIDHLKNIAQFLGVSESYMHSTLKQRMDEIIFRRPGPNNRLIKFTFKPFIYLWLIQNKDLLKLNTQMGAADNTLAEMACNSRKKTPMQHRAAPRTVG